jgi:very-short-patch-repair endonuclease
LGYYQFDFGIKEERILLEVQGDYWHGNPSLFNENGEGGKRKLHEIQKTKIQSDKNKFKFALDNDFKIYYIWESDIKNNNFETLYEIRNEIQNRQANHKSLDL